MWKLHGCQAFLRARGARSEQAAAQFAECIISATPEREASLGRFIGEALRLRYGRDDWVSRDDAIDLWWDVVETLRRMLEAGTLPGQLGNDPAAIKHVLDVEIPTMPRAQIEQMVDYFLGCFRLSRGHLGRHRQQHRRAHCWHGRLGKDRWR